MVSLQKIRILFVDKLKKAFQYRLTDWFLDEVKARRRLKTIYRQGSYNKQIEGHKVYKCF